MSLTFPAMVVLHGASALVYAALFALIIARRPLSRAAQWLALAALVTALWGASVAFDSGDPTTGVAAWLELARAAGWYWFILHLYRRSVGQNGQLMQALSTMGLLGLLLIGGLSLTSLVQHQAGTLWTLGVGVRLGIAVCNLLLLENLYRNTSIEARWHINLLCVALGGLFLYDLVLYADAALFHRVSRPLFEGRAPATIIAAPLIAVAAIRDRRWKVDIHVSREAVFHSFTLIASGIFLIALSLAGEVFRRGGAEWGQVVEITLICGGVAAVAVVFTSRSARSRIREILINNFFSHRYDYRREWMRCIETLTAPDIFTGFHRRAVSAIAEVVDSPAGVLFARAPEDVAFLWAGSWNTPAVTTPIPPGHPLIAAFAEGDGAVVLDEIGGAARLFPDIPRAWLAVPLNNRGELIGFVVVTRSRGGMRLDREVYELLGVAGQEVASRLAEQRAALILSQTRQLREYSERFAFVLHDIKNVSGQLSMLLSNAEVHGDNPEFQRDMLATVRASVGKITRLLARLQAEQQERGHALFDPIERLKGLVSNTAAAHRLDIPLTGGCSGGLAIDPEAFDSIVTHLLDNAIEASPTGAPVHVAVRHEGFGAVIDIVDQGTGMSPEFIRDTLFQPFASTKGGGHGIGVYQARQLLREAGGDLLVLSQAGSGTTMRILLPLTGASRDEPLAAA